MPDQVTIIIICLLYAFSDIILILGYNLFWSLIQKLRERLPLFWAC